MQQKLASIRRAGIGNFTLWNGVEISMNQMQLRNMLPDEIKQKGGKMTNTKGSALLGPLLALMLCGPSLATAEKLREAIEAKPPSAAILELRRRFMGEEMNALTFHTIGSIFNTRPVHASGVPSPLASDQRPLSFSYVYNDRRIPADEFLERTYTNALLIWKDGKIVFERYRNFTGPGTSFLSMSIAKSIVSMMVGIALQDGVIRSLDDQIVEYVPELRGSAYDGVTLRQALDMKTGVDRSDNEQFKPGTPGAERREEISVRNTRRAVEEALLVGRKEAPGKVFDYSTLNTTVIGWVLERAAKTPLAEYMSAKLWRPLGAEADGFWMVDGATESAQPFSGMGYNAVLRDYARLGIMMLNGGKVQDRQVVPRAWVEESTGGPHPPTAPGATRGYQHFWWTVPNSSAYTARGLQGQFIFIDPQTRTVIVKLSYFPLSNRDAGNESDAFFFAASRWSPK